MYPPKLPAHHDLSRSANNALHSGALVGAVYALLAGVGGCSSDISVPTPGELTVKQIGFGQSGAVELSWELIVRVDRYTIHYDVDGPTPPFDGKGLQLVQWQAGCGDFDAGNRVPIAADLSTDLAAKDASAADAPDPDAAIADAAITDASKADAAITDASKADAAITDASSADASKTDSSITDGATVDTGPIDTIVTPDTLGDTIPSPDTSVGVGRAFASPIQIPAVWCLDTMNTYSDAGVVPVHSPGRRPRARLQNLEIGQTYFFAIQAGRRQSDSPVSPAVKLTIAAKPPAQTSANP